MPRKMTPIEDRFWQKVNVDPNGCWEWRGAIDPQTGYGRIGAGCRRDGVLNAHRLSYELAYGTIGDGLLACHTCHNRACVRPGHLYEGTHTDNLRDRYRRERRAA